MMASLTSEVPCDFSNFSPSGCKGNKGYVRSEDQQAGSLEAHRPKALGELMGALLPYRA